jgi:hypothetical protein
MSTSPFFFFGTRKEVKFNIGVDFGLWHLGGMVKRTTLNYIVNLGLLASFSVVFLTGMGKFPLLLRSLARNGLYLPSNQITLVHEWGGVSLGSFILLHIVLHWKWIVSVTRQYLKRKGGLSSG